MGFALGIDPWKSKIACPLLVINSEEYTCSDDFPRLEKLCQYAQNGAGVFSIGRVLISSVRNFKVANKERLHASWLNTSFIL